MLLPHIQSLAASLAVSSTDGCKRLFDDQCAGHIRVTFASADINIGSRWRSHDDSQGLFLTTANKGPGALFPEVYTASTTPENGMIIKDTESVGD